MIKCLKLFLAFCGIGLFIGDCFSVEITTVKFFAIDLEMGEDFNFFIQLSDYPSNWQDSEDISNFFTVTINNGTEGFWMDDEFTYTYLLNTPNREIEGAFIQATGKPRVERGYCDITFNYNDESEWKTSVTIYEHLDDIEAGVKQVIAEKYLPILLFDNGKRGVFEIAEEPFLPKDVNILLDQDRDIYINLPESGLYNSNASLSRLVNGNYENIPLTDPNNDFTHRMMLNLSSNYFIEFGDGLSTEDESIDVGLIEDLIFKNNLMVLYQLNFYKFLYPVIIFLLD
jgi:hypothetical protein